MGVFFNTIPKVWPKIVGCDLETTGVGYPAKRKAGLDPFLGKILSIAFSDGKDTWIFLHTHGFEQVKNVLQDENVLKIFHNAKFDLKFIKSKLGIEVENVFDTMLAEQALTTGKGLPVGLKDVLARRVGNIIDKETREEFYDHPGFHIKPITPDITHYICEDVLHLPKLRELQLEDISRDALGKVLKVEFEVMHCLVDLELAGFKLDLNRWLEIEAELEEKIQACKQHLAATLESGLVLLAGVLKNKSKIRSIPKEEINFGSSEQMADLIHQVFGVVPVKILKERGKRIEKISTDEETLERIYADYADKPLGHFVREVLELRKWEKRLSYAYGDYVHELTGKVHPSYHQMGTRTGRFSCSDPNMQQVPRPSKDEPNLREIWTADSPDHCILALDYNQNEPRVMADLSGDPTMIAACQSSDVYSVYAEMLCGHPVKKGDIDRQIAKSFVLAVSYRSRAENLWKKFGIPLGLTLQEVQDIVDKIETTLPVTVSFGKENHRILMQYGYIKTALGRRCYVPEKSQRTLTVGANTPVQGTAADIFKVAMVKVHNYLKDQKKSGKITDSSTRVWHVVHDELEVHCLKSDAEWLKPEVIRLMEEAGSELCGRVKHIAEGSSNYRWSK